MAEPFGGPPVGDPQSVMAKFASMLGVTSSAPTAIPDNRYNESDLLKLHREYSDEAFDELRYVYERVWWRNLLYTLGRQWIVYHPRRGWVDKRMARWVPRPVTNKVGETVESIQSIFSAVKLESKVRPGRNDPKSIRTAEVCDRLEPFLSREHQMDRTWLEGDFWLIVTGNTIYHPWWDQRAETGMMLIPWEECLQCGKTLPPAELQSSGGMCPACGGASFKQSDTQGDEIPKGRGVTDACSPFEIAPCPGHTRWEEVPYIYRLRWRTKNYVEQHHPELAKKLNWEQMPKERSLQFLRSLPAQTDIGSMPIGSGSMGASLGHSEGISEYELWVKPSEAYPEGLVARFMGEGGEARVVVDESQGLPGPLPYTTAQGEKSWQFVHVPYKLISGRLWAAGPVDSIIQKQDQVNQLDALVQLTLQRTANPVWLEPEGSNIKHLTGVPGLIVRYTPSAAFDSKPERIDGKFLPTAVIQLRDQYLKDIESLTGTFDIIKGQRPTNVQAFSAMQLLVERSQSRFTVPLKNRGEAYRQLLTLQLELERQFGPTKRSAMINWPHEQTSYLDFTNADLQGDITVLIEDGSQSPKTNLGKRAAIDQLKNLGLLNIQDPQQTYQVFQIFGATDLVPAMDGATREAIFEMELFERFADQFKLRDEQQNNGRLKGVKPPPLQPTAMSPTPLLDANGFPVPPMSPQPIVELPFMVEPWQQHPLHLAHHAMWAQGDSARSIFEEYPVLKAAFLSHWLDHQARQQAAMMPQAIGPGGEGRVAGDGQALSSSNRESGDPGDVPRGAGPGARA